MRPDNTPVDRSAPVGRANWFSSVVVPAKGAADVSELAVSLTVSGLTSYALSLVSINWDPLITDAGAVADMNDIEDAALLIVPSQQRQYSYYLEKDASAFPMTVTNLFTMNPFVPTSLSGGCLTNFSVPFLPTTPFVFRSVNDSGSAAAAVAYSSNVSAYMYTREQYNQGYIWRSPYLIGL